MPAAIDDNDYYPSRLTDLESSGLLNALNWPEVNEVMTGVSLHCVALAATLWIEVSM